MVGFSTEEAGKYYKAHLRTNLKNAVSVRFSVRKWCKVSAAGTRCGLEWEKNNNLNWSVQRGHTFWNVPDVNALTQVCLDIAGKLKELWMSSNEKTSLLSFIPFLPLPNPPPLYRRHLKLNPRNREPAEFCSWPRRNCVTVFKGYIYTVQNQVILDECTFWANFPLASTKCHNCAEMGIVIISLIPPNQTCWGIMQSQMAGRKVFHIPVKPFHCFF